MLLSRRFVDIPASFFGIVLGMAALGSGWSVASTLWHMPSAIGRGIGFAALTIWALLAVLYAVKWTVYREHALAEFRHPVQCCFVGLIPVSAALVALPLRTLMPVSAWVFAITTIAGQLAFGLYRTGELWRGDRDPATNTPILYLPTVAGSFVSTIVLSAFGHPDWAKAFFGVGMLSWLAIESVLVHRLYVVSELTPALRPTLGIQLAPPAVACVAYQAIAPGTPDLFSQALIGYALFQALLLVRLFPWIRRQPFAASYWAFTFGVSALPTAMMRYAERGGLGFIADAAPFVFLIANVIIASIAIGTLRLLFTGHLLPPLVTADLQTLSHGQSN
jgi:tellurite resistance protein